MGVPAAAGVPAWWCCQRQAGEGQPTQPSSAAKQRALSESARPASGAAAPATAPDRQHIHNYKQSAPSGALAYTQRVFNRYWLSVAASAALSIGIACAPLVHADDDAFIDELRANQWSGVNFRPDGPADSTGE